MFYIADNDLFWLAGWLEGEGSFLAPSPSKPNSPAITAVSTDLDVITKVGILFGVSPFEVTRRHNKPHWKRCWRVQLRGLKARTLMLSLKPLMGERRKGQIDRALQASTALQTSGAWPRKLDVEKVLIIKQKLREGHTHTSLAGEFGVTIPNISQIAAGRIWKRVA